MNRQQAPTVERSTVTVRNKTLQNSFRPISTRNPDFRFKPEESVDPGVYSPESNL